jgi:hypothetical protein
MRAAPTRAWARPLARAPRLASNAAVNPTIDSILAGLGLAICAALLLRYALPAARRQRLDSSLHRTWASLRSLPRRLGRDRKLKRQAERQADEAINRARRQSKNPAAFDREGNVYRPDAFKSRPPKDKLH